MNYSGGLHRSGIVFKTKISAPEIEPWARHPHILETFNNLVSGEVMKLINDHVPRPLRYQFMAEREGLFTWEYLEEGPIQ